MVSNSAFAFEERKEEYFRIEVPGNFVITKTTPVEDFDIFSIGLPEKSYVKLYVGNHPEFPSIKGKPAQTVRQLETQSVKIVSIWNGKTLIGKEMLINLPNDSFPGYIHAWTSDLSPAEFLVADQIIMSLKVMNQLDKTLWQIIDALIQQIPFSKQKVEAVLAVQLIAAKNANEYYDFFRSPPIHLAEGVVISDVDLRIRREGKDLGFLVLGIGGVCITEDQLKTHYSPLKIIGTPHGHSLEEATTFSPDLPWGKLFFGFKERNPDCLATVGFDPKED